VLYYNCQGDGVKLPSKNKKVRFGKSAIFQKFLKNPLTNYSSSAIIQSQRARAVAASGDSPKADERHKLRIRIPDKTHKQGSPEMVERHESGKGRPKKILTNAERYAIIKI